MIEYLALILVGCFLGIFTGITPGLHVNTIALMGIAVYPSLNLTAIQFAVAMMSMAVTHTFLDFIPAIFVGVPQEDTALSVLPAHKMVLEGKALDAVYLTAAGSLLGLAFALALIAPALYLIPLVHNALKPVIVYVLVFVMGILILRERTRSKIGWSAVSFFLAGAFGMTALNLKALSGSQALFPIFAGLFGLSNILYSIKNKTSAPPQKPYSSVKLKRGHVAAAFVGALGGIVVGVLPGMSPSQVGILIWEIFGASTESFLVSVSAINTSDAIHSLVTLYTIGNARSGVASMIGEVVEIRLNDIILLSGAMAVAGLIAVALYIWLGRCANKIFSKVDYYSMNLAVVAIMVGLIYYFTGFAGLFVAAVATCIGLVPILAGVSRTHLMGVLLLPTILFYFGLG